MAFWLRSNLKKIVEITAIFGVWSVCKSINIASKPTTWIDVPPQDGEELGLCA